MTTNYKYILKQDNDEMALIFKSKKVAEKWRDFFKDFGYTKLTLHET